MRGSGLLAGLVVVLLLTTAACERERPTPDESSATENVATTRGQLEWTRSRTESATIDSCASGQHYDYFGVVLRSASNPNIEVRIRRDVITEEYAVRIDTAGAGEESGVVFRSDDNDCDTFDVLVENTGNYDLSYADIRRGHLDIACHGHRGPRVTADITFDDCN